VSWSDLKAAAGDAGFEPIPANTYDAVVDTASAKKASSGKDMISVAFTVTGGPYDGRKVFTQLVLSPEKPTALGFFFRHMAALGLSDAYFAASPSLERVASDLAGRPCRVIVGIREWQGSDRNEVSSILAPSGGVPAAPSLSPADSAPPAPGTGPASPATAPGVPVPGRSAPAVPAVPAVPAPSAAQVVSTAPVTPPPPPAPALGGEDDLPF
jgi:Protein of unknown function (DUF669)